MGFHTCQAQPTAQVRWQPHSWARVFYSQRESGVGSGWKLQRSVFDVLQRILMFLPLIALLFWAAIVDVRRRRIPNWITFTLMLSGLCLAAAGASPAAGSFLRASTGLALGFGLALVLY